MISNFFNKNHLQSISVKIWCSLRRTVELIIFICIQDINYLMADFNPQERVKKMVAAIKNEAREKYENIMDNASQQFKIEKNKLINQQKEKITEEFKKQIEAYTIQKRIQRSSLINESRLSKMQVRYEQIQKLKGEIKERLQQRIKDQALYANLLRELIVQGLIKLMETKVELSCRQQDLNLVKSVIPDSEKEFTKIFKDQTGHDITVKVNVNTDHFLDDEGRQVLGGVVLSCQGGRIVCSNTLDERIELAFQEFLPDIRSGLFPEQKRK